jgi:hypothetical protein
VPAKRTLVILGLILLVGLGLRVHQARNPIAHPGVDADTYSSIARQIYQDHSYGGTVQDSSDWSPGAPLLYSSVYFLTGGVHVGAARLLVALLGTLTILVVFLLGRRLGGDRTGVLAAALVAIYPYFIYDAGRLMTEPLGCLVLASAMLALLWANDVGRPLWAWLVPGLLFGLTALARPEYLLFGVVFSILVLIRHRRAAAVFAIAFAFAILPWTIRNFIVLDRLVPISTGGGKALFIGTYLPGDGSHFKTKLTLYRQFHPHSKLTDERVLESDPRPIFDQVAAKYPNLSRDAALAKIGRENFRKYAFHQPLDYLAMLARKAWRMWSPSGKSMDPLPHTIFHYALLVLGLTGLALLAARRRFEALPFGLVLAGITFTGMALLAGTRRNVVLMPLVITLASFTLTQLGAAISSRRGRPADSALSG